MHELKMYHFPESHRFCDRVQDAYTMRCCPQVTPKSTLFRLLQGNPTIVHPADRHIYIGFELEFVSSLLCFCTQVHGIANDTINFVKNIINTEINSATDNPVSLLLVQSRLSLLQKTLWTSCLL